MRTMLVFALGVLTGLAVSCVAFLWLLGTGADANPKWEQMP